ncbi:MAG: hypothetical protein ACRCY8_14300 [Dermatophilaceae bacterium]
MDDALEVVTGRQGRPAEYLDVQVGRDCGSGQVPVVVGRHDPHWRVVTRELDDRLVKPIWLRARPVDLLRDQVVNLDASIGECAEEPVGLPAVTALRRTGDVAADILDEVPETGQARPSVHRRSGADEQDESPVPSGVDQFSRDVDLAEPCHGRNLSPRPPGAGRIEQNRTGRPE